MDDNDIVEVDLSHIKYIDQNSRVRLNMTGATFEFQPITAAIYYDYLTYDETKELEARTELIQKCLISPKKTVEELANEDIAILNTLFEYLFNYSFLKKVNSDNLKQ